MQIQIKSKRTIAVIAIIAAVLIILIGTFAWNSINQQRINVFREPVTPGVNLHDDFDAPNKDIYVENSGEVRVIVRVRLTEFLQTAERGSLVAGHERTGENETDNARLNWTPHSGTPDVPECEADEYHTLGENWPSGDWFHEYYEWKMGGQKYYMPAKELLGTVEDENDENFGEYIALLEDPPVCDDTTEYDGTEEGVRQTLPADVITMSDWLIGGRRQGEFWVVDTDGWCYWAQQLPPDTATGLLLDSVTRTGKVFDSDAEYCINVWLQAVDEIDIDLFRVAQNGGITNDAMLLVQILAEKILLADDGAVYENNYNGTYTQMTDSDGNTLENPRAFIPLGEYADSYEAINTDENVCLYLGDTFDLTALVWDGDSFTNYDTLNVNAPWYNITVSDEGAYTVEGTETGADGIVYLRISDSVGKQFYLASIQRNEVQTFTVETAYAYKQSRPGTAPFGLIYQGGVKIGTNDDSYYDQDSYVERYFTHIGSGVYVEVAAQNDMNSIDDPIVYYFAGMVLGTADTSLNNLKYPTPELQQSRIDYLFPFSIAVDDGFSLAVDANGDLTGLVKDDDGDYTMVPLVEGADGGLYIELDDGQYIGPGGDGMLGGTASEGNGFDFGGSTIVEVPDGNIPGGDDTVVLAQPKPPGIGSQADPYRIRSRTDMDWLSRQVNLAKNSFAGEYLVVTNDISMGEAAFTPIGWYINSTNNSQFFGIFDGGGYTISGLKVDGGNYSGLFGYIGTSGADISTNGKVCNLTLDNAVISGAANTGAVAGNNYGIIDNVTVKNSNVAGTGNTIGGIAGFTAGKISSCQVIGGTIIGLSNVGGVAGSNQTNTIEKSYSTAVISGNNNVGGVAGNNTGTVTNCYAWGDVTGYYNVGGVAGNNTGTVMHTYHARGTIKDTHPTGGRVGGLIGEQTTATAQCNVALADGIIGYGNLRFKTIGRLVGTAPINQYAYDHMTLSGSSTTWYSTTNGLRDGDTGIDTQTPALIFWADSVGFDFNNVWKWDTTYNLPNFTGVSVDVGSGTGADPYLIKTRGDMDALSAIAANATDGLAGKHFKVANNIDMGGTDFTPIGTTSAKAFKGVFDGGNYTISRVNVQRETDAGLFGFISDAAILNLRVEGNIGCSVKIAGGVIGTASGGSVISNCVFSGSVSIPLASGDNSAGDTAGGIVGRLQSTSIIEFCYVTYGSEISGYRYIGGLAGLLQGTDSSTRPQIHSCYSLAKVTGSTATGGILGQITNAGIVSNSAFIKTAALNSGLNALGSGGNGTNVGSFNSANDNSATMPGSMNLLALLNNGQSAPLPWCAAIDENENDGYPVQSSTIS